MTDIPLFVLFIEERPASIKTLAGRSSWIKVDLISQGQRLVVGAFVLVAVLTAAVLRAAVVLAALVVVLLLVIGLLALVLALILTLVLVFLVCHFFDTPFFYGAFYALIKDASSKERQKIPPL